MDLQKNRRKWESLVKYLDGMEVQFGQVLEELRDVKEQLSQIQDGGVKASVLRIAEQAQGKVQEVGGQLNTVRKNLIQSAGNALQTYKEKGEGRSAKSRIIHEDSVRSCPDTGRASQGNGEHEPAGG